MRYFGQLIEEYALRLAKEVFPESPAVGVWVSGEQRYGKPEKKTSDIAIALGSDLVLVEVGAGRLTEASRVTADWMALEKDLDKLNRSAWRRPL